MNIKRESFDVSSSPPPQLPLPPPPPPQFSIQGARNPTLVTIPQHFLTLTTQPPSSTITRDPRLRSSATRENMLRKVSNPSRNIAKPTTIRELLRPNRSPNNMATTSTHNPNAPFCCVNNCCVTCCPYVRHQILHQFASEQTTGLDKPFFPRKPSNIAAGRTMKERVDHAKDFLENIKKGYIRAADRDEIIKLLDDLFISR